MKQEHTTTTTALVIGGCVPRLRHLLLLSLLVATYVLTDGEGAAASSAPARSSGVLTAGSVEEQEKAASVARAAADRCAGVARNAGFRTRSRLVTAVAVGMAESTCRASAQNRNGPTRGCPNGSIDRGMWQINDCYHPSVSKKCAYNAQCNAKAAYRISRQGTDWTPWASYNSGSYRRYLDEADAAVDRLR